MRVLLFQYFTQEGVVLRSVVPAGRAARLAQQPRLSPARVPGRAQPSSGCAPRVPGGLRASERFVLSARKGEVSRQKALHAARVFFSRFDVESVGEHFALLCTACLILFSVYS